MDRGSEHFLQMTYKWPTVHEKMLNITNHQGICKARLQWNITSHLFEWLLTKREEITSVGKDVEKREFLCTVGGKVDWYSHYGGCSKILKIELPYDPAIPLLDIYLKQTKSPTQKNICTPMFVEYAVYIHIYIRVYTHTHTYIWKTLGKNGSIKKSKQHKILSFFQKWMNVRWLKFGFFLIFNWFLCKAFYYKFHIANWFS